GFTLIELLVVLAIVALMLTLATPRYIRSLDASKETALRETLRTTRETIDKFYADTGRYPESLEELVEKKYLRALPFDPLVDSSTAWQLIAPQDGEAGVVFDVKSTARGANRDGKPYAEM
ncbi:MAG TPA: prepilin-type N-terminal cleavage/methylation domain-containing protein, partial [Burkholderiaceae bacterium]|nr:prepilin-type N-terminal cleavage/methylation domain-containing protein [Burkholderiaceae bacterium]